MEVNITTVQGHIHGHLHVAPGSRVKDQLDNKEERFIAITDATFRTGESETYAGFVAVNKEYVIAVIPIDEPRLSAEEEYPHY